MTNAHVVNGAERIQMILPPPDSKESIAAARSTKTNICTARIVGVATDLDIALLKVDDLNYSCGVSPAETVRSPSPAGNQVWLSRGE